MQPKTIEWALSERLRNRLVAERGQRFTGLEVQALRHGNRR